MIAKILRSKLFKTAGIYTLTSGINGAIPFFLLPILTRYLTPEDYGIVSMFSLIVTVLSVFTGLSVHGAIFNKYFDNEDNDLAHFISNCLVILLTSTALFSILIFIFKNFITKITAFPSEWLWAAICISLLNFIISIRLSLWQAQSKAIHYGLVQIIITLINIGFSVIFVVSMNMNWHGRILAQLIASIVGCSICLILLFRAKFISFKIQKKHIRYALNFGLPLIPHSLGALFITMSDRVLITNLVGVSDTGIFTVAAQIGMVFSFIIEAFNKAYAPWLFEKLKQNSETFKMQIVRGTYLYFLVVILVALVPSIIPSQLISIFLGPKFVEAKTYFLPLFIGYAFNGMYYMVCNYIFFQQKTKYLAYVTFISGAINIVFSYFLIKINGPIGAAQGTAIAFAISFVLTWYLSNKVYPMPWFQFLKYSKES